MFVSKSEEIFFTINAKLTLETITIKTGLSLELIPIDSAGLDYLISSLALYSKNKLT